MTAPSHRPVLVVDFGAQYAQLIARRVREAHVYCEIHPPTRSLAWIREWNPAGIILSGGNVDLDVLSQVIQRHLVRTARLVKRMFPHLKVYARARNRQHVIDAHYKVCNEDDPDNS